MPGFLLTAEISDVAHHIQRYLAKNHRTKLAHCEHKKPSAAEQADCRDGIDQTLPGHRSPGNRFDSLVHGKSNVLVDTLDNHRNVAQVAKRHRKKFRVRAELLARDFSRTNIG